MINHIVKNGVIREEWNTDTGVYSRYDKSGEVLDQRPLTDDEITRFAGLEKEQSLIDNATLLRDRATQLRDRNAEFLALTDPTYDQLLSHVKRLTRLCSVLSRLVNSEVSSTDD